MTVDELEEIEERQAAIQQLEVFSSCHEILIRNDQEQTGSKRI